MTELKAVIVNLKSLDQDIPDPIIAGGGDANSRSLRIIFTQEAQAQITSNTKVYLKWHHQELNIDGYNVFKQCNQDTNRNNIWEIKWPLAMLHEGNVLCCVELVDEVSIGQTTSFIVRVLADPHDGSHYVVTEDFTEFQQACVAIATLRENVAAQFETWKVEFAAMKQVVDTALHPVELTNLQDGQYVTYNASTQKWVNTTGGGSGGLPVDITDPQNGQALLYNSTTTKWTNKNLADGQSITYSETSPTGLGIKGQAAATQGYVLAKDTTGGVTWIKPVDTATLDEKVQQAQISATQAGTYAVQAGNAAVTAIEAAQTAEAAKTAINNKMWYGSMAQYNALETINPTTFYFILDGEISNE